MLNVAEEFKRFCGPSVLFDHHIKDGRTLTICYSIPAIGDERYRVVAHLRNGLDSVLRMTVKQLGGSAFNHAYRVTGHRDADMQRLLQGKLV